MRLFLSLVLVSRMMEPFSETRFDLRGEGEEGMGHFTKR